MREQVPRHRLDKQSRQRFAQRHPFWFGALATTTAIGVFAATIASEAQLDSREDQRARQAYAKQLGDTCLKLTAFGGEHPTVQSRPHVSVVDILGYAPSVELTIQPASLEQVDGPPQLKFTYSDNQLVPADITTGNYLQVQHCGS